LFEAPISIDKMNKYLLILSLFILYYPSFSQKGFKEQIALDPYEPSKGFQVIEDTLNSKYVVSGEYFDQSIGRWTIGFYIFNLDGNLDTIHTLKSDTIFSASVSNQTVLIDDKCCILALGGGTRNVVCLDLLNNNVNVPYKINGFENIFNSTLSSWGFENSKMQNSVFICGGFAYGENNSLQDAVVYKIGSEYDIFKGGNNQRRQTALNIKRNSKGELVVAIKNSSIPFDAANDITYLFFLDEELNVLRNNIDFSINPNFRLGKGMVIDKDDNILVTGAKRSGPSSQLNNQGVVKFSPEGIYEWTSFISNSINNVDGWGKWHSIIESGEKDGYIIAGSESYQTSNRDTMISKAAIAKISHEGDSLWMRTFSYGTSIELREEFNDVIATSDGGYLAVGSSADFSAVSEETWPWVRTIVLKVDKDGLLDTSLVSVVDIGDLKKPFHIFPNPVNELLYITQSVNKKLRIQVCDLQGRMRDSYMSDNSNHTIIVDVNQYESGMYIIKAIDSNGQSYDQKFIVE